MHCRSAAFCSQSWWSQCIWRLLRFWIIGRLSIICPFGSAFVRALSHVQNLKAFKSVSASYSSKAEDQKACRTQVLTVMCIASAGAGVWFLYLLLYGLFPLSLSQAIYHLFVEVLAPAPVYWLIVLVTPFACVLPGFFIRQACRCSPPQNYLYLEVPTCPIAAISH